MATKKSAVLNFFSVSATEDSKAVHKDCGEKVARGGGSQKHLQPRTYEIT